MAAITICSDFGVQKIKFLIVSTVSPSICHEVMGQPDAMILVSCMLSFKPTFSLSSFTFIKVCNNENKNWKLHTTIWMNLTDIMLIERNYKNLCSYLLLYTKYKSEETNLCHWKSRKQWLRMWEILTEKEHTAALEIVFMIYFYISVQCWLPSMLSLRKSIES